MDDSHIVSHIGAAADFKGALMEAGYPVKGVYVPPEGAFHVCVVSTETPYPHIANRIANFIWGRKNGFALSRIIVVNDDIDPSNMAEVFHAFATKCHPTKGTFLREGCITSPLTGFLSPEEKKYSYCSNVVYDCTWPLDWPPGAIPPRASFNNIYPREVQEATLRKLAKHGL